MCQQFIEDYGSHVSTEIVHFGGTFEWKSVYTGKKSETSDSYKNDVASALHREVSASGSVWGVSAAAKSSVDIQNSKSDAKSTQNASSKSNVTTTVTQVCVC